jgi:uncharacterized membrane protein YgaE (UPF0421/DUF939 family)
MRILRPHPIPTPPALRALAARASDALPPRAHRRVLRLRDQAWPIAQAALAAGLAWLVASRLLGHRAPAFAPIAAIIAIGEVAHRRRRAVELFVGVSMGIALGDVLANVIGTGPVQLAVVIALAMSGATLLGAGVLTITEAAVSAVIVVAAVHSNPGITPSRFLDAVVGCGIAYVVAVVFPRNVDRAVSGAADPVFGALADLLDDVSMALATGDSGLVRDMPGAVDALDEHHGHLDRTIHDVRTEVQFAPAASRARRQVERYARATPPAGRIVRDVHALSRASVRLLEDGRPRPPELADAVSDLAWSVRLLAARLDDPERHDETVGAALRAAHQAAAVAESEGDAGARIVVDVIRAGATDVMRAAGASAPDHDRLGPPLVPAPAT